MKPYSSQHSLKEFHLRTINRTIRLPEMRSARDEIKLSKKEELMMKPYAQIFTKFIKKVNQNHKSHRNPKKPLPSRRKFEAPQQQDKKCMKGESLGEFKLWLIKLKSFYEGVLAGDHDPAYAPQIQQKLKKVKREIASLPFQPEERQAPKYRKIYHHVAIAYECATRKWKEKYF